MSINRFGIAAALAVSGVMMTPAMGDLTGMSYEVVGENLIDPLNGDCWTVRVYLDVDPGNQLNAVAGNSNVSKTISTSDSFYQDASAGPTSLDCNSNFFQFAPDMEWDSYVTVGCLHANGFPFDSNAMNQIGMDWDPFEAGGTLFADNGTWFATPGEEQCFSANHNSEDGVKNGVLIAQLTVLGGPGSTITFEGLFQGREADGVTTWQTPAAITISAPEGPMDCNGNGVDDSIDLANGFSQDCNNNNVPDECDIAEGSSADCDFNDVPDECQGDDCDGNGVPDSCDLADGAADCDNNGVLDICDLNNGAADCNGNSVPDSCDIAGGSSDDCDGDGTPDECETDSDGDGTIDDCEYTAYTNLDLAGQPTYDTWADCIAAAQDGNRLEGDYEAFNSEPRIDFLDKDVTATVMGIGSLDTSSQVKLGDGSHFDVGGAGANFGGNVSVDSGEACWLESGDWVYFAGSLSVQTDATFQVLAPAATLSGYSTVAGSTAKLNLGSGLGGLFNNTGNLTINDLAQFYVPTTDAVGSGFENSLHGLCAWHAKVHGDVRNKGTLNAASNNGTDNASIAVMHHGNMNNTASGHINVRTGTYYLHGNLTNNGQITGDFESSPLRSAPLPGDGMAILGSYTAGPNASMNWGHENYVKSIGGHVDIAINDSANFNMDLATLRLFANGNGPSTIEAMSQDLGETFDGLDGSQPDNYPIGRLEIVSGDTVLVVDNKDNAEGDEEIMYVGTLVVAAGSTFDGNGQTVWCGEIINNGTILGDVDVIDPAVPCDGDYNGDEFVNIDDLLLVLGNWGEGADDGDGDGDGDADIDDLLIVLGNWGFCE